MRNVLRTAMTALIGASVLLTVPAESYAQTHRSAPSGRSSSHSSYGRSSSSVSSHRSSPSSSSSRSSSVSRSSSASRSYSAPARSSSVTRSSGGSSVTRSYGSSSVTRSNGGTRTFTTAPVRSGHPTVSRGPSPVTRSAGTRSGSTVGRSASRASSAGRHAVTSSGTRTVRPAPGTVRSFETVPRQNGGVRGGGTVRSNGHVTGGRPSGHPGGDHAAAPGPVRVHPHGGAPSRHVHPRDRGPLPYDRPGHFWSHHHPHYFGWRVNYLPAGYVLHRHYGIDYYLYGGVYYRPFGGYYVVCRPPYGCLVTEAVADLAFSLCRFAWYSDLYSTTRRINSNYETLYAQNEQIARNNALIAQQNATIAQQMQAAPAAQTLASELGLVQSLADAGTEYFYQDGVFYVMENGQYKVIVPPAGALVDTLPDDYETLTLNGTVYYQVDDTVYRLVMSDGKTCFEVLGQRYAQ